METTLLLLFSVVTWAQDSTEQREEVGLWTTAAPESFAFSVPESTVVPDLSWVASGPALTGDPEKDDSPRGHIRTPPPSASYTGHAAASPETPTDRPVSVPTVSPESSTQKPSVFPAISDTTSDSAVSITTKAPGGHTVAYGILATVSLEPSRGTGGPPITMATGSTDLFKGTSGLPVSMATKGHAGSPTTLVKVSTGTSVRASTHIGRPAANSDEGTQGTLLPVLVALLVVIILVALLLLWRQRQIQRSGVLMLNGVAKRNGDAWAGPAPEPSEQVLMITLAEAGGDKGSGDPSGEASGRRPTLTTFFDRRKSCQGSVALEDLEAGAGPGLQPEEGALMGTDGALEASTSDGPEAGDGEPPSSCE